jgi:hypothetical protein
MKGKKSNIIKKKIKPLFFVWKLKLEIEINKGEKNKSSTFFFYTENFYFPCFIKQKIKVIQ